MQFSAQLFVYDTSCHTEGGVFFTIIIITVIDIVIIIISQVQEEEEEANECSSTSGLGLGAGGTLGAAQKQTPPWSAPCVHVSLSL